MSIRPIGPGDAGPAVRDLQTRLAALGHDCSADEPAVSGPATEAAVRAFQRSRGLVADGLVGADTWRALVEAGRALGDRRLYLTDPRLSGDDVRQLQEWLNNLGFNAGYPDAVFGPDTVGAVREFQENVGLRVDGIVGHEVVEALRRLLRPHQSAAAAAVREREQLRAGPRRLSLAGARVLLDAARGPEDPGRTGPDGHLEHEITWQLSTRVEGRLLPRGVHVVQSRGPSTTPPASRRASLANDEGVDLIVSVQCNGLDSPAARGVAGYHFGVGTFSSDAGLRLAELAVDAIVARTGAPHCRTHPIATAIVRESRAPAVVIEPGFLSHPEEGRLLADPAYQEAIAAALTDAVAAFLTGVPSLTPAVEAARVG